MRVPFRQGIVRAPQNFLDLADGTVSIVAPPAEAILVTFADGASNYLLAERLDVPKAWPGPFPAGDQSFWLYWDIDRITGAKTYGYTIYEPIEAGVAPQNPRRDQHWYDTRNNKLMVWNPTADRWQHKIRVFAAELTGNATFSSVSISAPLFTGTQTGISAQTEILAGALMFDADGKPLKRNNGTFFTTEDVAITGVASSSHVKVNALVLEGEAVTNIPAFSVVYFNEFNKITLANSEQLTQAPYGVTDQDAATGKIVNVMMDGVITNPAWDWTSAGVNAPVYVNSVGEITTTPGVTPVVLGYVVDRTTIVITRSTTIVNGGGGGQPIPTGGPNQVLGMDALGLNLEYKDVVGTPDQIVITKNAGKIQVSLDDIDCGTF